jgi:rod shape-determining protein MreD
MAGTVTPETGPSAVRRAATTAVLAVALFAAVVVQLTVVNRLPWPGSAAPDVVLLLVTAIAVGTGPAAGAVSGFCGGLALDIAPPAAHYAGEYALVFCLAGYGAAKVVRLLWDTTGERDPLTCFTVMAVATAAGEAGKAALGLLLSEPDVTTGAVARVLPAAILYDLLLAPFVYAAVAWVTRGIRTWGTAGRPAAPQFSYAQRLGHVFRQASAGAAPDLRLSGTGVNYRRPAAVRRVPDLRLSGTGADYHRPASPRRVPRLRLSGSTSPAIARTGAGAPSGAPVFVAGARAHRLSFAGDLKARTIAGQGAGQGGAHAAGRAPLRYAGPRAPRFGRAGGATARTRAGGRAPRTPGRNWLRSAGLNSAGLNNAGLSSAGRAGAGRLPVTGASALAARSAPSGFSALAGPATPLARRSPQAGWLRGARSAVYPAASRPGLGGRALTPRRGWLGTSRGRPRTVIGSGARGSSAAFRRGSIPRGNWYTAAPSRAWLRRSRHPWRKRRQRLLRIIRVGR